jgi:hypothetical protein
MQKLRHSKRFIQIPETDCKHWVNVNRIEDFVLDKEGLTVWLGSTHYLYSYEDNTEEELQEIINLILSHD